MKLVVIDGQSGRTGALLVERIRAAGLPLELLAVGTNAIATAAMMKAGGPAGRHRRKPGSWWPAGMRTSSPVPSVF